MVGRPDADRWAVVTLAREGLTRAEIVRRTGFDARFVSRCMAKFQLTGTVADCARSGRKRKRTPVVEKKVVELMRGKRRRSCRVVAQMLKAQGFASIHRNTVWRTAHDQHLRPYRMQRTSRLTPNQKRDRLAFAIAQANRDWSCTVFSDEHVFRQFKAGNPCHDVVWAQHASEVPPQEVERWSLSVNAWAGISNRGKTCLHFYNGTLDAPQYQKILARALLPATHDMFDAGGDVWELQQDKASCHLAKSTKQWLEAHEVAVMDTWPTKGDDINPIENLWAVLDERVQQRRYTTLAGMKRVLREEWNLISQDLVNNLIASIPDRLRRIRKSHGGSIKRVS